MDIHLDRYSPHPGAHDTSMAAGPALMRLFSLAGEEGDRRKREASCSCTAALNPAIHQVAVAKLITN